MSVEWLNEAVRRIASLCAVIAVIEFLSGREKDDGIRLVSGAAVVLMLLRTLSDISGAVI